MTKSVSKIKRNVTKSIAYLSYLLKAGKYDNEKKKKKASPNSFHPSVIVLSLIDVHIIQITFIIHT